jgi:MFS family permease
MNYLQFVRKNSIMVVFGIMMTTLSSFGQTFLLALYVPFLITDFDLSNSSVSTFYGIATIISASMLPKIGKLIDTIPIRQFTLVTTVLFVVSLLTFSLASVWWVIPISFLGLRLAGQGLYSHISITAMSRYFDLNRGKAISLASLGHPLGQAVLPAIILVVIGWVGWRESLWINAGVVTLVVFVFTLFFLKENHLQPEGEEIADLVKSESKEKPIRQRDIMRSKEFWLLAPNVFFIPFATTGLFFYQIAIVDFKGWSDGILAAGLSTYAVAGAISILTAGPLIDKYRAKAFFPWYLIPFFFAILGLWLIPNVWSMFVYMLLMGLSVGFGSAILAALQVEFFGKKYIGSVRSLFTSMMVLSSAVGPALYGIILDSGWGWEVVLPVNLIILFPIIIQSFRAMPRFTRAKWKFKYKRIKARWNNQKT